MQRIRLGKHSTAVACDVWIDPIFIHIAVKDFAPLPIAWETDAVAEAIECRQVHHDDHIVSFALHPAVPGEHAILIVAVQHAETLPAQGGIPPAQPHQFAREPYVIEYLLVALVEAGPIEQQVFMELEIVGPLFVLQELLAHEQHRDARRASHAALGPLEAGRSESVAQSPHRPARQEPCGRRIGQ
jgi:hypothetical protein